MSNFKEMVAAAESNPASADFAALREAYRTWENRSIKHISRRKLMEITNHVNGFDEVAQVCRTILEENPLDLEARMMIATALERAGNREESEKQHLFAERLLDTILETGNGKSFETAWKITSETETSTIMRVFGMRPKRHTRHRQEDRIIDVYEGVIGDREATMYFDVTDPVHFVEQRIIGESSE